MYNPTWTPWLENPGTGECPVPGWAEDFWVCVEGAEINDNSGRYVWRWYNRGFADITHYRYAIPADLADLAQTVPNEEPRHYEGDAVCYSKLTLGTWVSCHPTSILANNPDTWTNHDRDRARRDLAGTSAVL